MNDEGQTKVVYEQYWLHARHQENQRLWYTNIFAIITAGIVAYLSRTEEPFWYLPALVAGLSWLGFFFSHCVRIPFLKYSRYTDVILWEEWGLGAKYARFIKEEPKPPKPRTSKTAILEAVGIYKDRGAEVRDKASSVSLMFHTFYIIMASVFTGWATYLLLNCLCIVIASVVGTAVAMWAIYNFWFGSIERKAKEEIEFKVNWKKFKNSD